MNTRFSSCTYCAVKATTVLCLWSSSIGVLLSVRLVLFGGFEWGLLGLLTKADEI